VSLISTSSIHRFAYCRAIPDVLDYGQRIVGKDPIDHAFQEK
jgi:hypothetical protein